MKKRALFINLDGTLIKKIPPDMQAEPFEQLELMPGVIRNLYFIRKNLNFELVIVTRQNSAELTDGTLKITDRLLAKVIEFFANEAITFDAMLDIGEMTAVGSEDEMENNMKNYFSGDYDLTNSYFIGADEKDMQLAETIGCKGIQLTAWEQIAELLFAGERRATIQRTTKETDIFIRLDIDGNGVCNISTGIGFFNHLLEQIGKHSMLDLTIKVKGDLFTDEHHTIEDTAIALGEAIYQALGSKRGIERYGFCLPMDDCLCSVALDFGGRSWLVWDVSFKREKIGDMPTEMLSHFFKSLSDAAKMNLYIKAEGENEHHKAESIFKALAKTIKMAVRRDIYHYNLPTTKGLL